MSPLLKCSQSKSLVYFWIIVSVVGVGIAAVRICLYYQQPGPFDATRQGFCDFHNGVYFPSVAYRAQVSPYSQVYADTYPVSRQVPPYSPLIIALHVPFAVLPLAGAEVSYFFFMVGCVVAIAWILVKDATDLPTSIVAFKIWPVVAMIVWSRPGHITLFNGYFTFELVLGVAIALSSARSRPWLSAFGMALASGKPTYFLPLCALMTARGDYAAVIRGVALSLFGAFASMLWITGLSPAGFGQAVRDVLGGQETHMADPFESPVTSWIRIDIAAVGAKVLQRDLSEWTQIVLMLFLLVVPASVLWRYRTRFQNAGLTDLSGSLLVIASIVAIYHNAYDAVLLMAPIVGVAGMRWQDGRENRNLDWLIFGLLLIPMFNPFSTYTMLQRFQVDSSVYQLVTSSNAVAIFLAALLLVWRIQRQMPVTENS